ncbi:hypothetical protein K438DRAFT_2013293 [Mycena galopus ATCC 62051]|nr:hypothetical protein K438DRAFT_2013293 [Mycena galopus ATCC 62051]
MSHPCPNAVPLKSRNHEPGPRSSSVGRWGVGGEAKKKSNEMITPNAKNLAGTQWYTRVHLSPRSSITPALPFLLFSFLPRTPSPRTRTPTSKWTPTSPPPPPPPLAPPGLGPHIAVPVHPPSFPPHESPHTSADHSVSTAEMGSFLAHHSERASTPSTARARLINVPRRAAADARPIPTRPKITPQRLRRARAMNLSPPAPPAAPASSSGISSPRLLLQAVAPPPRAVHVLDFLLMHAHVLLPSAAHSHIHLKGAAEQKHTDHHSSGRTPSCPLLCGARPTPRCFTRKATNSSNASSPFAAVHCSTSHLVCAPVSLAGSGQPCGARCVYKHH